jgi:GNAT superfamily N-acetyltransferase
MGSLTLRQADPTDSEFAYTVKRAAFRGYVEQVWGWDEAVQRGLHAQRFATQDYQVISEDGEDVGVAAWVAQPDCLKVNQLFILPGRQGRGVGRQVMLLVMAQARELGLPVRLQVLKVNPRALAFYERLGFVGTGETGTHDLMEWRP